jgi:hypothetical protein
VTYLTTIERFAIERGKVAQAREAVVEVLTVRFGSVPDKVVDRLNRIDDLAQMKHMIPTSNFA